MNHFLCGHPLRSVLHSHASQRCRPASLCYPEDALFDCSTVMLTETPRVNLLTLPEIRRDDWHLLAPCCNDTCSEAAGLWVTLRVKFSVSNTPNAHLVGVWCQQGHRSAQHCLSSQSVAQRHSCSCVYSPPLSHHSCCFSTASISSSDITCL